MCGQASCRRTGAESQVARARPLANRPDDVTTAHPGLRFASSGLQTVPLKLLVARMERSEMRGQPICLHAPSRIALRFIRATKFAGLYSGATARRPFML